MEKHMTFQKNKILKNSVSEIFTILILILGISTGFANVELYPKNASRDAAWKTEDWSLGSYLIHTDEYVKQIVSGKNVSAKMTWTFPGPSGDYTVKAQVLSHFSCMDKAYVKVNSTTVINGNIPKPNLGYCCETRGQGCRNTAKDNLSWMTGSKIKINQGDKIEYGGTTCVCFDRNKIAHGSYVGIHHLLFEGSGSGTPEPTCGNGKCDNGEKCNTCEKDCGKCAPNENPVLKFDQASINFSYRKGDSKFPISMVKISNGGTGTLPKLSATSEATWLSLSISGSGNDQTLNVTLGEQARNAIPKDYTSSVVVKGDGVQEKSIPLALKVTDIPTGISGARSYTSGMRGVDENNEKNTNYDIRGIDLGKLKKRTLVESTTIGYCREKE